MSNPNPLASILELIGQRVMGGGVTPSASGPRPDPRLIAAIGGAAPGGWPVPLAQAVLGGGVPETLPAVYARPLNRPPDPGRVFDRRGILPQMAAADPALAERLYEAVTPLGYTLAQHDAVSQNSKQNRVTRVARAVAGLRNTPRVIADPPREDAWRLYLGLPQRANTFRVSDFKPSRSSNDRATYFTFRGIEPLEVLRHTWNFTELSRTEEGSVEFGPEENSELIRHYIQSIDKKGGRLVGFDTRRGVMGHFTISKGVDDGGHYLSYYDAWDLDPDAALANKAIDKVGHPFEVYDRVYYDPKTFEPIQPSRRRTGGR